MRSAVEMFRKSRRFRAALEVCESMIHRRGWKRRSRVAPCACGDSVDRRHELHTARKRR
jgi:hypothetical protein